MLVLPACRNQSIDLHSKSTDWFLHEGNTDPNGLNIVPCGKLFDVWFCPVAKENSLKSPGVIIDENLTLKNHIEVIQNKICKNAGVLYRVSHSLEFKNLKIYFSLIHIYINYPNIASASTFKTMFRGILKKQKYAARIIFQANQDYY